MDGPKIFDQWQPLVTVRRYREQHAVVLSHLLELELSRRYLGRPEQKMLYMF
jgi:hypothetical protein